MRGQELDGLAERRRASRLEVDSAMLIAHESVCRAWGAPRTGTGLPELVAKALVPALMITRPLRLAVTTLAATKSAAKTDCHPASTGSFA